MGIIKERKGLKQQEVDKDHEDDYTARYLRGMQAIQLFREEFRLEKDQITITVEEKGPVLHYHLSDIHFGHDAVNYELFEQIVDYILETDNVIVTFYGDVVEGLQPEYLSTNVMHTLAPLDRQLFVFRDRYIRHLCKKGKIVSMVSQFSASHENWMLKLQSFDPYMILADGTDLTLVSNGGTITAYYPGKYVEVTRAFHNSPRGGNDLSPVGGLRASEKNLSGRSDIVVGGHYHTAGPAASREWDADGETTTYMQLGAFKGTDATIPDYHSVQKFGGRRSGPAGSSTLHIPRPGSDKRIIVPSLDLNEGVYLNEAARLIDLAENNSAVDELREKIFQEVESQPEVHFNRKKSRRQNEESHSANKEVTSFKKLYYDIYTKLPYLVMNTAMFRENSRSADIKRLENIISLVAENPYAAVIVLRQMIDAGVEKHFDREMIVDRLVRRFAPIAQQEAEGGNPKILAWLFDGILRYEEWKYPKRKMQDKEGKSYYEDENGFMAGTYISENTGSPLINNQGELILSVKSGRNGRGKQDYNVMVVDRTGRAGSSADPTRGLLSVEMQDRATKGFHDIVVGGHLPKAANLLRYDSKEQDNQLVMATGILAKEHSHGGKGNRAAGSPGGSGFIITPNERHIIPVTNPEEAQYLHLMLLLHSGLTQIAPYQKWETQLKKSKSKRR